MGRLIPPLHSRQVRWFDEAGSTNDLAREWAEAGAEDLSLVGTDRQLHGRGRGQRAWLSTPGKSLTFSLVILPTGEERAHLPLFSPLIGVALCEILVEAGLSARIKWPNDVLVGGKKVAGILAEASSNADQRVSVVLGVGINLSNYADVHSEGINYPAATLADAGYEPDRFQLLSGLLKRFILLRKALGSAEFLRRWERHLAFRGELVRLLPAAGGEVIGVLEGLSAGGELLMRTEEGETGAWNAGEISLRPLG